MIRAGYLLYTAIVLAVILGIAAAWTVMRRRRRRARMRYAHLCNRLDGHERVMMTLRRDHQGLEMQTHRISCRVGKVAAELQRDD